MMTIGADNDSSERNASVFEFMRINSYDVPGVIGASSGRPLPEVEPLPF